MYIRFDQHFLDDEDFLNKLVDCSKISSEDTIVEIGPGKGSLTKKILEKTPKKLISIEKDELLISFLEEIKEKNSNFEFILGNGLEEIKKIDFDKIIANIPYSITEPLYETLLDKKVKMAVLTHGMAFYKKLLDNYHKWHHFVNAFYDIELIEEIDGSNFNPPTKVKSAVVKLSIKEEPGSKFEEFVRNLYHKKDRSCKNAFVFSLVDIGYTKKEAKEILEGIKFEDKIFRNISNDKFYEIYLLLKKYLSD